MLSLILIHYYQTRGRIQEDTWTIQLVAFSTVRMSHDILTLLTLLDAGGGGIRPPYHINVVPRKMLKEKVANFL